MRHTMSERDQARAMKLVRRFRRELRVKRRGLRKQRHAERKRSKRLELLHELDKLPKRYNSADLANMLNDAGCLIAKKREWTSRKVRKLIKETARTAPTGFIIPSEAEAFSDVPPLPLAAR